MRSTHTLVALEVDPAFYAEAREKYVAAGYDHAIFKEGDGREALDMNGIALVARSGESTQKLLADDLEDTREYARELCEERNAARAELVELKAADEAIRAYLQKVIESGSAAGLEDAPTTPMARAQDLIRGAKTGWEAFLAAGILGAAKAPLEMVLHCPECRAQHVDAPDEASGWTNPPHRTHRCKNCGWNWRPADVFTTGVASVKTRGELDGTRSVLPGAIVDDPMVRQLSEEERRGALEFWRAELDRIQK